MAKRADYLISGVWFETRNGSQHISYVMVHIDGESSFSAGIKTLEADVIRLIRAGKSVITITWNYPSWDAGAKVGVENYQGREILRTAKDATKRDNLDSLIRMSDFF